jgi:hypothetical protein
MPLPSRLAAAAALTIATLAAPTAHAQMADPAAIATQKSAMERLRPMLGRWRGTAVAQTPGGPQTLTHTERVGPMLDGTLVLVEGKSFAADGGVPFNAFATISYDVADKAYWMTSYAQGHAGRFRLVMNDTGWSWEMPAGPATIRYMASFAAGRWHETGDYVAPGQPPRRIFEMALTRIGDSDWPAAGGVPRD